MMRGHYPSFFTTSFHGFDPSQSSVEHLVEFTSRLFYLSQSGSQLAMKLKLSKAHVGYVYFLS